MMNKLLKISSTIAAVVLLLVFSFSIVSAAEYSGPATATAAFTQSDLTGTWNYTGFQTGSKPGWDGGTVSINSSGELHFVTYEDTYGYTAPQTVQLDSQ